jgi:hypothetical protein
VCKNKRKCKEKVYVFCCEQRTDFALDKIEPDDFLISNFAVEIQDNTEHSKTPSFRRMIKGDSRNVTNFKITVEPLVYALLTYASLIKTSDLREKFFASNY